MEKREYRLLTDLSWLPERSDWAGLEAVGSVRSTVTRNGTTSTDMRFFITSLTDIERFAYAVRKHWPIENQLHWALDVIFDEDASRARKDLSPLNLSILRKIALALCKHADFGPRVSLQKKRFTAALDPDRFLGILFAKLYMLLPCPCLQPCSRFDKIRLACYDGDVKAALCKSAAEAGRTLFYIKGGWPTSLAILIERRWCGCGKSLCSKYCGFCFSQYGR